MRRRLLSVVLTLASLPVLALTPGTQAPDFLGTDSDGKSHRLSECRVKYLADVKTAHNYLKDALNSAIAGKIVPVASTRPYGCSVKYKD